MPIPTPPVPTPQAPAPAAKAPAPEQPATFSGSVRMVAYSDVISTGEGKAAKGVDFDRVEAALKRVSGVSSVSYDNSSRSISVGFAGGWSDLKKLEMAVSNAGASAELVSPARVIFRPMVVIEDENKVLAAVKNLAGVQYVTKENNDFYIYADLSSTSLDSIRSTCESAGVKGVVVSHEEVKVAFGPGGNANSSALQDDLAKTKWVLKVDVDPTTVKVLAVKGRITKALVKSLMSKHGFAEAK